MLVRISMPPDDIPNSHFLGATPMSDSVAIVTGVRSGLGKELGVALADEGCFVVGVSRRAAESGPWSEKVRSGAAHHIVGDVGVPETVEAAFEFADTRGNLNLVVNCAGQGIFGSAGNYDRKDIDDVLQGNLIGTILFSEAAFSRFKTSGGTIVNVMSTAAHVPRAGEAIYCASKWGARGYTESLRLEAKGSLVRVIAVYPGGMSTEFWRNARGAEIDSSKFMDPTEVVRAIIDAIKPNTTSYISDIIINRK